MFYCRRSINLKRRSVSFVEEPVKPESPANESFSKYLQPSQSIPEETSSPVSVMDSYLCQKTPDASLLSSGKLEFCIEIYINCAFV